MTSQRWLRIIPVAFVMYTIAFIDRTNISMALPAMSKDLGMNQETAGRITGIFFWGYLVLQIPGGYFAHRWSAKKCVSVLLVFWGICAIACGFVQTSGQFLVARLMLGVAEGGVWPAVLVMLSQWFPRAERARANAFWMLCLPISVIVSSPISGWIMDHWSWRVMLVAEGVLPFIWLMVWLAFIYDHPREAPWISAEERQHVEAVLKKESAELEPVKPAPFFAAAFHPVVLTLIVVYFLLTFGTYGYNGWLPTALKKTLAAGQVNPGADSVGHGNTLLGFLNAIPYVIAAVTMVLVARHSDRTRQRRNHVVNGMIWSGACLAVYALINKAHPVIAFVFVALVMAGPWAALAPFWAIPSETLPRNVAASSMGLINAFGNLGGYFGPWVVGLVQNRAANKDDYDFAFMLLAGGLVLGGFAALLLPKSRSAVVPAPLTGPTR